MNEATELDKFSKKQWRSQGNYCPTWSWRSRTISDGQHRHRPADHGLIPASPDRGVGRGFFAIHSFDYLLNADEH
jgi:hypothetical protein